MRCFVYAASSRSRALARCLEVGEHAVLHERERVWCDSLIIPLTVPTAPASLRSAVTVSVGAPAW